MRILVIASILLTTNCVGGLPIQFACADSTSFDRYAAYARDFEQLGEAFDVHVGQLGELIKQRNELVKSIRNTDGSIAQLRSNKNFHNYLLLETQLMGAALEFEFEMLRNHEVVSADGALKIGLWGDPTKTEDITSIVGTRVLQWSPDSETMRQASGIANTASELLVRRDALTHHIKTLNVAGQLTVKRRLSLVVELQGVFKRILDWKQQNFDLFNQYWALADVSRFRSDVELKSGLVVLHRASKDNLGADFAEAITLMRLGRNREALDKLNFLVKVPPIAALSLAARAEVKTRLGEPRESQRDWSKAQQAINADSRIRLHHANILEAQSNISLAKREWEKILASGDFEVCSRRALALINISLPKTNDRLLDVAEQHATVASKLAAEADWACELTLAIVQAASGEKQAAKDTASRAASLALGGNQLLCLEVVDKIEQGEKVVWDFAR